VAGVLLAAGVLTGAACSDGSPSTSEGSSERPSSASAVLDQPTTVSTPASAPVSAPVESPSTAPVALPDTTPVLSDGSFCDDLLLAAAAFDLIGLEGVEGQTPEEIRSDFDTAMSVMDSLVDAAPAELVDPVQRLRAAFETMRGYYLDYDYDLEAFTAAMAADPALVDSYVDDLAALDADGGFEAGMGRLTVYQRDVCGHDVEG
jgi:hypothetical protein